MDTARPPRTRQAATRAAVALVAAVAAIVSYAHMYEVALAAGEAWRAWLLPLSVDGMIVASSLGAWQARRRGTPVPAMTTVSLTVGLAVSVAANIATPLLPWILTHGRVALSAIVAAWPAIALGLAFEELLRSQVSRTADVAPATAADDTGVTTESVEVDEEAAPDTVDDTTPAPTRPAGRDDEVRDAARDTVRQADRDGVPVTGKQLGERYGRGESWGRNQIRAVRAERQRPALVAVARQDTG